MILLVFILENPVVISLVFMLRINPGLKTDMIVVEEGRATQMLLLLINPFTLYYVFLSPLFTSILFTNDAASSLNSRQRLN